MILFGLAFGIFELIALAVLFPLFLYSVHLDRNYTNPGAKWYTLLALLAFAAWCVSGTPFSQWPSIWRENNASYYLTWYACLGLGYSLVEFALEIYRSKRYYAGQWTSKLATTFSSTRRKALRDAITSDENAYIPSELVAATDEFVSNYRGTRRVISVKANPLTGQPEPFIVLSNLAASIPPWIMFWPFYALDAFLGDLLARIGDVLAEVFLKAFSGWVKAAFKDTFKVGI